MNPKIMNCPHCGKIISMDALTGKEKPKVKCRNVAFSGYSNPVFEKPSKEKYSDICA